MTDITISPDLLVELVDVMGSDQSITKAAKVSTLGAGAEDAETNAGLINFLMKNRHGTPFEHAAMTFRITAPIFVWREFHRHRIGFSYNEESGRYKQLEAVFYLPPITRNLIQKGKPGHYTFEPGTPDDFYLVVQQLADVYQKAYDAYETLIIAGVAKEVARMCLPVSIFSTCYVTCNPRSLMAFLSLRTINPSSMFPSFPMYEISNVADQMEGIFAEHFPVTHDAFYTHGRVSP